MVLSYSVSDPIKYHVGFSRSFLFYHSTDGDVFQFIVCCHHFGGFWLTIYARAVLVAVAFWKFSNNPPNSASVADAITLLIMLYSTFTGPFSGSIDCIGVLDFGPRKKYLPALLRAFGS